MSFYCVACKREIAAGAEVMSRADGSRDANGEPRHVSCLVGFVAVRHDEGQVARTSVTAIGGRLVCSRHDEAGIIGDFIELPASLKQPLMAMVAEAAHGKAQADFPVPGGDRLDVSRLTQGRGFSGVVLERTPLGFPLEGRHLQVADDELELFIIQCRAV